MKKSKTQKGITLVALIITIIVLLILAVIAIRAVQGDGIITHAKNARNNYNQAQMIENGTLQNYADYITRNIGEQLDHGWKLYEFYDSKSGVGPRWVVISGETKANVDAYTHVSGDTLNGIYKINMLFGKISAVDGNYIIFGEYSDTSERYYRFQYVRDMNSEEVVIDEGLDIDLN